jgi:hypothetical protein
MTPAPISFFLHVEMIPRCRNANCKPVETEYSVVPSPAQPTPEGILEAYKAKPINLEALFTGGNPLEEAGISDESSPHKSRSDSGYLTCNVG